MSAQQQSYQSYQQGGGYESSQMHQRYVSGQQQPTMLVNGVQYTSTPSSTVRQITAGGGMGIGDMTGTSYEKGRSTVASNIISSEFMGEMPQQDEVKYIEVPVYEERTTYVTKKEVIEKIKEVSVPTYETVERVVEIPQIQYVDKMVEVPQFHEVVRRVPRVEVRDVTKEVIRTVPKIENRVVEKVVNVPGQIIEVPKPYTVENAVTVPRYVDKEMTSVVAQTLRPMIRETDDFVDVDVLEYEPHIISVDVHVPKVLQSHLVAAGAVEQVHRIVDLPAAHYNSLVKALNPHFLGKDEESLPYIRTGMQVDFVPIGSVVYPAHDWRSTLMKGSYEYHSGYQTVSGTAYPAGGHEYQTVSETAYPAAASFHTSNRIYQSGTEPAYRSPASAKYRASNTNGFTQSDIYQAGNMSQRGTEWVDREISGSYHEASHRHLRSNASVPKVSKNRACC